MSQAFDRGVILFQQGRHDLASQEFRRGLSEDPDYPLGHAFLALCLAECKQKDEALREADEAVRLAPSLALSHYARSRVLLELDRLREASLAIKEAISLDPDDADYRGLLASIEMARHRWAEALEVAESGLAIDPENTACVNLRAMALTQLGRKAEAAATLGSALADDPENAVTHANQGWAYLHQSDPKRAIEHFREALRLDPELEWARVGMIEALKAKHLIYRVMLRFFLWMGRQSTWAQWGFILGFIFGQRILNSIANDRPELAVLIVPILILSFIFLLLTWISVPLFNFLLQLNRFGRLALSREQKIEANLIGGCFAISVCGLIGTVLFFQRPAISGPAFLTMAVFGLLILPLRVTFLQSGTMRIVLGLGTLVLAGLALPRLGVSYVPGTKLFGNADFIRKCFGYFIQGAIYSTWLPLLLSVRTLNR
jgi:tetratricopeptide (TPR) repeat protein